MRAFSLLASISLIAGVIAVAGCGRVAATPDAGDTGSADAAPPDAGAGCTASAFSCGDDNALYQCDAEGVALTKVQDCQYGCSVDHCNECDANTTFCSADDLVMCDGNGNIVNPQTCEFGCQANRCNTCDPGVAYCDGANAVTCGSDGEPASTMNCGTAGCLGGVCNTCVPNTTSCDNDKLVVCNGQGKVQSATTCSLGCSTTPNAHCKALVPSYGVPAPSGSLPAFVVDADATLDISNCSTLDVLLTKGGQTTAVSSAQLASINQSGGPPICVVRYGTITIASGVTLTVVNSASAGHVMSLQAVGNLDIAGTIAFVNAHNGPAPGGTVVTYGVNADNDHRAPGGGGGGGASVGAKGGACIDCNGTTDYPGGSAGAAVTTILSRLTGGSTGGSAMEGSTVRGGGGKGGGGLQLVSLTRVQVAATGRINLNGRGGWGTSQVILKNMNLPTGGGGSGGSLVVEAPTVNVSANAIVAANGGAGGGACYSCTNSGGILFCSTHDGQPGQLSTSLAAGGSCGGDFDSLGDGGYGSVSSATPGVGGDSNPGCTTMAGGGGGGAAGFVILRARTQTSVMIDTSAVVSPAPTREAVTAN